MGTKIVELRLEIHYPQSENTPEELLEWSLSVLAADALLMGSKVIVIRSNAFEAPEPEPSGQDPDAPRPIPDDGSTGGDG